MNKQVIKKNFVLRLAAALLGFSVSLLVNVVEVSSQTTVPNRIERNTNRRTAPANPLKLERSLFYEKPALGAITALVRDQVDRDSQPVFVVAGNHGAAFVDGSGKAITTVRLERKAGRTVPVDMNGDGKLEYIDRSNTPGEVCLFDQEGRRVWKYGLGTEPEADDMACGDLDGDGELECVVAMKGMGGLRLLDRTGKEKWRRRDVNVWNVEILDTDGDGKYEILHSNVAGRLRIRNGEGTIVRELSTSDPVALFSICRWPAAEGGWAILNNKSQAEVQLLDFKGETILTLPTGVRGYEAFGTPVTFTAGEEPYFALLICNRASTRNTRFFIYNSNGDAVYEEDLPTLQASLLTISDEKNGSEALLVGENEGRVWRFRSPSSWQPGRN